jgi:hypothetical protein
LLTPTALHAECATGRFAVIDPQLAAATECRRCPEPRTTTVGPAASSADDCICAAGHYDAWRHGVAAAHPQHFDVAAARELLGDALPDV